MEATVTSKSSKSRKLVRVAPSAAAAEESEPTPAAAESVSKPASKSNSKRTLRRKSTVDAKEPEPEDVPEFITGEDNTVDELEQLEKNHKERSSCSST
jgi:hypothetical protein